MVVGLKFFKCGSSGIVGGIFVERSGFGNQGLATAGAPELGLASGAPARMSWVAKPLGLAGELVLLECER